MFNITYLHDITTKQTLTFFTYFTDYMSNSPSYVWLLIIDKMAANQPAVHTRNTRKALQPMCNK